MRRRLFGALLCAFALVLAPARGARAQSPHASGDASRALGAALDVCSSDSIVPCGIDRDRVPEPLCKGAEAPFSGVLIGREDVDRLNACSQPRVETRIPFWPFVAVGAVGVGAGFALGVLAARK